MLSLDTAVAPDADVICTPLKNGESVLLHLTTQTYFSLNETGTRIWSHLENNLTLSEVADELVKVYDISQQQAAESVLALTSALYDEKLVVHVNEAEVA